MEKLTIFRIFIPVLILSSLILGPLLNLLTFLNTWVLETHWSIYINDLEFANLMTLSFILFTVVFIITMKFIEKLAKDTFIAIAMVIIGFSCIFAGLLWNWQIVFLVFTITSVSLAFLIPTLTKYASDIIHEKFENPRVAMFFPISLLIWVLIFLSLFATMGSSWRILFYIGGGINILSSFVLVFF
jgi:MFS family permease